MSADLPIIKSLSENDFIHSLRRKHSTSEYVWLGMRRNQSGFLWFDSSPAEQSQGALYSARAENGLENKRNEKCALLELNTKVWRDYQCQGVSKGYVLCQKGRDQEGP